MPHKPERRPDLRLLDLEDAIIWAETAALSRGHYPLPWQRNLAHLGMASTTCRHCGAAIHAEVLDAGASWSGGGETPCPGGGSDTTGLLRSFIGALIIGALYFGYAYATNR